MFAKELILPLLWGVGGGFSHCIGMCGIFVISCNNVSDSTRSRSLFCNNLISQALFHTGRLCSLALLGVAAGSLGSLVAFGSHYKTIQAVLSVAAGILMACLLLGFVGIVPLFKMPEPDVMGAGNGFGRRLFGNAIKSKSVAKAYLIGTLVGLLPCGLTYNVLMPAAATASPVRAALVMVSFGIGTIPGLAALGLVSGAGAELLRAQQFRKLMTSFAALMMLAMAIQLIYRGYSYLM